MSKLTDSQISQIRIIYTSSHRFQNLWEMCCVKKISAKNQSKKITLFSMWRNGQLSRNLLACLIFWPKTTPAKNKTRQQNLRYASKTISLLLITLQLTPYSAPSMSKRRSRRRHSKEVVSWKNRTTSSSPSCTNHRDRDAAGNPFVWQSYLSS